MAITTNKPDTTVYATEAQTTSATAGGSNSHIVQLPNAFFIVRVFQFIVAVVVLGLTARLISETFGGTYGQEVFGLVAALFTIIVIFYDLTAEARRPAIYNMWAILALDALMTVFWLVALAVLAALSASIHPFHEECDLYFCFEIGATPTYRDQLAAAAGMSGLEFLLFIGTLVPFSMALHKHRASGAPTAFEKVEMGTTGTAAAPPATEQYVPPPQQPTPANPIQHAAPAYQAQPGAAPAYSNVPVYDGSA